MILNEDVLIGEVIDLEVAQRLHANGLSFDEIDNLRILPQMRQSNESGLMWDNSQRYSVFGKHSNDTSPFFCRDPLIWQTSNDPMMSLNSLFDVELAERVNGMVKVFCPNLTCIEPMCPYHCECP